MSNEEAIKMLRTIQETVYLGNVTLTDEQVKEAIEKAKCEILAAQPEPCEDAVSRQAAIDAFEDTTFTKNEILRRLSELPSVQPEIIRCNDCKYRDADDFCTGRGYPNVLVPDDGFCDKGERRTDEQTKD